MFGPPDIPIAEIVRRGVAVLLVAAVHSFHWKAFIKKIDLWRVCSSISSALHGLRLFDLTANHRSEP